MSQYSNTIFYFIGTSSINIVVNMTAVKNVTLHGLDQSPSIYCYGYWFRNSFTYFFPFILISYSAMYVYIICSNKTMIMMKLLYALDFYHNKYKNEQ